jgi:hypothetical protein
MKKSSIFMFLVAFLSLSACAQLHGDKQSQEVYRGFYGDKLSKPQYRGSKSVKSVRKKHGTYVSSSYSRGRLKYAGGWGEPTIAKEEETKRHNLVSSVEKGSGAGINKPLFIKNLRTILSSASEMMDEFDRVEQQEAAAQSVPK